MSSGALSALVRRHLPGDYAVTEAVFGSGNVGVIVRRAGVLRHYQLTITHDGDISPANIAKAARLFFGDAA